MRKADNFFASGALRVITHAASIQLLFRLDSILEACTMTHCVLSDLGIYFLNYRLPKNISIGEEQTKKIVTGGKRIYSTES